MTKAIPFDQTIQRIGIEVDQRGSCLVSEEELRFICGEAADESARFACIRDLAMEFQWAFVLDGQDSSVLFRPLPA